VLDTRAYGGIESHIYGVASALNKVQDVPLEICFIRLKHYGEHILTSKLQTKNIRTYTVNNGFLDFFKFIQENTFHVLHSHGYKANLWCRLTSSITQSKHIATYHSGDQGTGKLYCYDFIDRLSSGLSHQNIAVSEPIAESLYSRANVMFNALDCTDITLSWGNHIGYVGRFSSEKAPERFVEIARALMDQSFVMVGDGPLLNDIKKYAPNHITLTGHCHNMEEQWKQLDLLVLPSHREGMPMVCLEAMARGIPVLTHQLGSLDRLIVHEHNGFLLPHYSKAGYIKIIEDWLALSSEAQKRIRNNTRLTILNHFGMGQYIDKLVRLYVSSLPLVEFSHTKHASFNNSQSRIPVLFVHYAKHEWIRGSERCLIDLVNNIDASRFEPIVWCDTKLLEATFTSQHITVYRDRFTILGDWEAPRFAINNTRYLCKRGRELIKLHQIQLIHCNSAAPAQWMVSVANQTRTPLVTQLHARYVFSERLRCRITSSDHIVGVSQPIIKQCQGDKGQAPHYHVVANGIDTNRLLAQPTYNLRMTYQLSENHFVMVSIGSLIHRKGMDLVIKACHKMHQSGIETALFIIGDGPEKAHLEKLIDDLNMQQHIFLLGEQKHAFGMLKEGVDVFISGAREEVFGLVFAEAGLAKLPCIAPDVGGISSVIEHNLTGKLCLPESDIGLYEACKTLFTDRKAAREMGKQGYHRVLQNFTISQNVQRMSGIYEEAILRGRKQLSSWQKVKSIGQMTLGYCRQKWFAKTQRKAILIIDTIEFNGGSKIATKRFLETLSPDIDVYILTIDSDSWQCSNTHIICLKQAPFLKDAESGYKYLLKHGFYALQLLFALFRHSHIKTVLGCSLPSNDMALSVCKFVCPVQWVQFIHGPVYASRLNGKLLLQTDALFYLDSARESIESALAKCDTNLRKISDVKPCKTFVNGLSEYAFSPPLKHSHIKVLWAASNLRWKGLDTFLHALQQFSDTERPECSICFIRAKEPNIPTSEVNIPLPHVTWLEAPDNLSQIRLAHSIFVSTSQKEPFGLSILEALAAGLCVLIPADNAYWDKKLTQGEHCWKYEPNDPYDLHKQLHRLLKQPDRIELLGKNGFMFAKQYAAQDSYAEIKSHIERQLI
jgi:glycosyltransferase involved in cell wall biosynthesis